MNFTMKFYDLDDKLVAESEGWHREDITDVVILPNNQMFKLLVCLRSNGTAVYREIGRRTRTLTEDQIQRS